MFVGLLLIAPVAIAVWLGSKGSNSCIKRGGGMRVLGLILAVVIGLFCVGYGYFLAYVGWVEEDEGALYQVTYPIAGWFSMVLGGLNGLVFILRVLMMTREEVVIEEIEEKAKKAANEERYQEPK